MFHLNVQVSQGYIQLTGAAMCTCSGELWPVHWTQLQHAHAGASWSSIWHHDATLPLVGKASLDIPVSGIMPSKIVSCATHGIMHCMLNSTLVTSLQDAVPARSPHFLSDAAHRPELGQAHQVPQVFDC